MTRRLARAAVAAALAAALLTACSTSGDEPADDAPPAPTTSVPTGDGPYPPPESPHLASPLPAGESGAPRGLPSPPASDDQTDATAVSKAALQLMWSYDTAIDTTAHDASVRMADSGLCTDSYAAALRGHAPRAGDGAQWTQWAHRKAYLSVELERTEEAGRPHDTDTTAYRQWTGTLTPHGQKGWQGEPTVSVAFVELSRKTADQPWRVSAITIR